MSLHFATQLPKRPSLNLRLLLLLVFLFAMIGSALMMRFASVEEARDLMQWQNRLNLVAESRAQAVQAWLEAPLHELEAVAGNPSLQLYVAALAAPSPDAGQTSAAPISAPPQETFLRNLLVMTADRLGFLAKPSADLSQIKANLPPSESEIGLLLLTSDGKLIVGTSGLTPLADDLRERILAALSEAKTRSQFINAFRSSSGQALIGYVVPVYPIQAEQGSTAPIAFLVGIKKLDQALWNLLRQPGLPEGEINVTLLRKDSGRVLYISPVAGSPALTTTFALETPHLAAAYALAVTGHFASKTDLSGAPTLMTSRALSRTNWVLMAEAPQDKALAESTRWLKQVQLTMGLAVLAFLCALIAVWYYGTSRRSYLSALEATRLAAHLAAREKLLRIVADNQLEPVIIVDAGGIVRFANQRAADDVLLRPTELNGKTLPALWGPARAQAYEDANEKVFETQSPVIRIWEDEQSGLLRTLQSVHIPLSQIATEGDEVPQPGVLMIDQDISGAVGEKERRLATQRQLVNALLNMVDDRDPYAAHQSAAVALVARAIGQEMQLEAPLLDTAETAGKLMNLGKVLVSSDLLGKPQQLAEDEKKLIRESLKRASAFLEGISFDGPVIETLQQMQERFDGQGPLRLQGDEILITARIIAVANAFVGMISPRAWRAALDAAQAMAALQGASGAAYDTRVVIALANYIENKKGQNEVMALLDKRAEVSPT